MHDQPGGMYTGSAPRPAAGAAISPTMTVGPADCAFIVGVPTDAAQFEASRLRGAAAFAHQFPGGWPQYQTQFLEPSRVMLDALARLGVHVRTGAGVAELAAVFRRFPVVVPFSHWATDAVELADGFARPETIIDTVPESYAGLVDLCVCRPLALVNAFLQLRGECLVKSTATQAHPLTWLRMYLSLFSTLAERPQPYAKALDQALDTFVRFPRGRRSRPSKA